MTYKILWTITVATKDPTLFRVLGSLYRKDSHEDFAREAVDGVNEDSIERAQERIRTHLTELAWEAERLSRVREKYAGMETLDTSTWPEEGVIKDD